MGHLLPRPSRVQNLPSFLRETGYMDIKLKLNRTDRIKRISARQTDRDKRIAARQTERQAGRQRDMQVDKDKQKG